MSVQPPATSYIAPSDGWYGGDVSLPNAKTEFSAITNTAEEGEVASELHGRRDEDKNPEDGHQAPPPAVPPCFCGEPAAHLMSRSERNPNRWFYKCSKFRDDPGQCRFFVWEDEIDSKSNQVMPPAPPTVGWGTPPNANPETVNVGVVPAGGLENINATQYSSPIELSAPKYDTKDGERPDKLDECFQCGGRGHWAKDCPLLHQGNTKVIPSQNQRRSQMTPGGYNSAIPVPPVPAPSSGGHVSRNTCFRCGREGHWARDCPDANQIGGVSTDQPHPPNPNPYPVIGNGANGNTGGRPCFKCGQEGHWARECPNAVANGGGSGGRYTGNKRPYEGSMGYDRGASKGSSACFRCGQVGHWSNNCPNR